MSPSVADTVAARALILVALPAAFADELARQASRRGYRCARADAGDDLRATLRPRAQPELVITNLDLPSGLEVVALLRSRLPAAQIAAVTSAASVVRIATAMRRGASTVVARPVTLAQICAALREPYGEEQAAEPMSLDRAIWEHLNQAVHEAGSIAAAARQLRLDRTSLKRMLRKVPLT